jgi:hypothetical protein
VGESQLSQSQTGGEGDAAGEPKKPKSRLPRDLLAEKMGIIDANPILRTFERILNVGQYITGKRFLEDSLITIVLTKGAKMQFDQDDQSSVEVRQSVKDFVHSLLQTYTRLGRFPRNSAIEQLTYIGQTLNFLFGTDKFPYAEKKVEYLTKKMSTLFSKQKLQQGDLLIQNNDTV